MGIDGSAVVVGNNYCVGVYDENMFQEGQESDNEASGSEHGYHSIYSNGSNDDDDNVLEYERDL